MTHDRRKPDGQDHHRDEHDRRRVNTVENPGLASTAVDRRQGPNQGTDGRLSYRRVNRGWVRRCIILVIALVAVFLAGAEWAASDWNSAYDDARADADKSCPWDSRLHRI